MRLYDSPLSGNCYKVRLLLAHLDLPYERIEVDVRDRTTRPELLGDKSPDLRIPVLEIGDGNHLAGSSAILWYPGAGTPYVPAGRLAQAKTLLVAVEIGERHVARLAACGHGRPEGEAAVAGVDEDLDAAVGVVSNGGDDEVARVLAVHLSER